MASPSQLVPHAEPESARHDRGAPTQLGSAGAAAITLGIAGVAVSAAGSWIPSFWGDEAASIMSATRPLGTLWPMLLQVDAVHGAYYLFLHGWIALFGASEFSVRLPSAIAMGIAVAGLVLLANRLATRRVAIFTGITCAVLPCITRMGAEARGYAFSVAIAVWLTWWLVRLTDPRVRPMRGGWVVYAVGVALGVYMFLYLALMVLVHAAILLATPGQRRTLRPFVLASLTAMVGTIPVIVLAVLQRHQIGFLVHRNQTAPEKLLINQWFGNPLLAALAWLLIIATVALWAASRRGARNASRSAVIPDPVVVGLVWLLLPSALLLVANLVVPLYSMRYVTFAAPAAALLLGLALDLPRRVWVAWLLVAALLVTAAPSWLQQRGPYSRNGGSDWSEVAVTLQRYVRPGDGVVFADNTRPSRRPRLAMHVYPHAFEGVRDLLLGEPYQERAGLWDAALPLTMLPERTAGIDRVWLLDDQSSSWGLRSLRQQGFAIARVFREHRTTIYELTRSTP